MSVRDISPRHCGKCLRNLPNLLLPGDAEHSVAHAVRRTEIIERLSRLYLRRDRGKGGIPPVRQEDGTGLHVTWRMRSCSLSALVFS